MKAKTLRPLLIVLLFGFLPTTGWMIAGGGANHTHTRVVSCSSPVPHAATARRAIAHSWPTRLSGAAASPSTGPHAQPTASGAAAVVAPRAPSSGSAPDSQSATASSSGPGRPASVLAPAAAGAYLADAGDYAGDGFGNFGIPGGVVGGTSTPGSPVASPSGSLSTTDSTGPIPAGRNGTIGSGHSASGGSTGASGGSTGVNLVDPPPGTTTPPTAQNPPGGADQIVTAVEPSTLVLFLAGMAAVGWALRRRVPGG